MIIKLIKKNAVRILALCICASMGFTLVGCKNSTDKREFDTCNRRFTIQRLEKP